MSDSVVAGVSESSGPVQLPPGFSVLAAGLSRAGSDLVVSPDGGGSAAVLIRDYFGAEPPRDLADGAGGWLSGDLAARMSDSAAPTAIAQDSLGLGSAAAGQAVAVDGTASVVRADGSTAALTAGDAVFSGDRLTTADGGAMSVVLADGTLIAMGPDSAVTVAAVPGGGQPGPAQLPVQLIDASGTIVVVAGGASPSGPEAIHIETAAFSIALDGTQVGIRTDAGSGLHEVLLMEDLRGEARGVSVELRAGGGEPLQLVDANQFVRLVPGSPPVVGKVPDDAFVLDHYGEALAIAPDGFVYTYQVLDLDAVAQSLEAFDVAAGGDTGEPAPDAGPIDVSNADQVFPPADPVDFPGVAAPTPLSAAAAATPQTFDHNAPAVLAAETAAVVARISTLQGGLSNVTTSEDAPTDAIPAELSVTGATGPLTVVSLAGRPAVAGESVTLLSGATVTLQDDNTFIYDPNGSFESLPRANVTFDQFSFEVTDSLNAIVPATVTVAVEGVNDAPVANEDRATAPESGVSEAIDPLANDTDVDDFSMLRLTEINGESIDNAPFLLPSGALVTMQPDRTLIYEPQGQFDFLGLNDTATDTFSYTVDDGQGGTDVGDVAVTITGEAGGGGPRQIASFEFSLGDFDSRGQVERVADYQETDGGGRSYEAVDGGRFALLTAEGRSFDRPFTGITSFLDIDLTAGDPTAGRNLQVFTDADRSQPVNGAAIKTTIGDLAAGDTVSFWAAFDNRDFAVVGKNDLAVVTADGIAYKLFDGRMVDNPPASLRAASDWTLFSYEVQNDGELDLGFAVLDDEPDFAGSADDSRLLIDDIRVNAENEGYTVVASDPTGALSTLAPNVSTG